MRNLKGEPVPDPAPIALPKNPVQRLPNGDIQVYDMEENTREIYRTTEDGKEHSYRRILVEPR